MTYEHYLCTLSFNVEQLIQFVLRVFTSTRRSVKWNKTWAFSLRNMWVRFLF